MCSCVFKSDEMSGMGIQISEFSATGRYLNPWGQDYQEMSFMQKIQSSKNQRNWKRKQRSGQKDKSKAKGCGTREHK